MKKSTLIHMIFVFLIALTIVGSVIFLIVDYYDSLKKLPHDDMKWWGLDAFIYLWVVGFAVLYELEVYRCVRYFALCTKKHILLTVINILSLLLVPGFIITGWIISMHSDPLSVLLLESRLISFPLPT